MMGNRWKGKISRTILNIFRSYNGVGVLKLPFLEELYDKTFVVSYVYNIYYPKTIKQYYNKPMTHAEVCNLKIQHFNRI